MLNKKENLIKNRLRSVFFAFKGLLYLIKTESSIQIQCVIAILVTFAGFYFNIAVSEWLIQILAMTIVLCAEGLNSAIEKLSDFVEPNYNKSIGIIKDVSAGAVLIAALGAIVVGLIIYIPKIF